MLSFTSTSAWKVIHGHRAENFEKDKAFYGPDIFGIPEGLIRANDVSHARQRKLVSHAFSDRALKDQESLLKSYAELLVTKLNDQIKETKGGVDIKDWYNVGTGPVQKRA
jgi:cytochrome P450